jgi:hypothetical protein
MAYKIGLNYGIEVVKLSDELIREMAKDLNVAKFKNEDEKSFKCRLIYSGIACWIKTSALDYNIFNDEITGVSLTHILEKNRSILKEMLERVPEVKSFFEDDKSDSITEIRTLLLRIGELDTIGFNTNVILHKRESILVDSDVQRELGCLFGEPFVASGLSLIHLLGRGEKLNDSKSEDVSSESWLELYVQHATWKKIDCIEEPFQVFNPDIKVNNNYDCWQDSRTSDYQNEIVLMRNNTGNFGYDFYLLHKKNGLRINQIDSLLVELGEIRRIMFTLRKKANNPICVYVKKYEDNVNVLLGARLPVKEEKILCTYAWPKGKFNNRVSWIMLPEIWKIVETSLQALGREIVEVKNNG